MTQQGTNPWPATLEVDMHANQYLSHSDTIHYMEVITPYWIFSCKGLLSLDNLHWRSKQINFDFINALFILKSLSPGCSAFILSLFTLNP